MEHTNGLASHNETENTKRTRATYSEDQKAEVLRLLRSGEKVAAVVAKTGVGLGTVNGLKKSLGGGKAAKTKRSGAATSKDILGELSGKLSAAIAFHEEQIAFHQKELAQLKALQLPASDVNA